ncbi:hypothetical protein, partial [Fodinicurvata halophila]
RYGHLAPVGDAEAMGRALLEAVAAPADPQAQKARAADFGWEASLAAYEQLLTGQAEDADRAVASEDVSHKVTASS